MRCRTSANHASGSTSFSLADWISVAMIDQLCTPLSAPANNAFLRLWIGGHKRNYVPVADYAQFTLAEARTTQCRRRFLAPATWT
jgi:hypothetical protein